MSRFLRTLQDEGRNVYWARHGFDVPCDSHLTDDVLVECALCSEFHCGSLTTSQYYPDGIWWLDLARRTPYADVLGRTFRTHGTRAFRNVICFWEDLAIVHLGYSTPYREGD